MTHTKNVKLISKNITELILRSKHRWQFTLPPSCWCNEYDHCIQDNYYIMIFNKAHSADSLRVKDYALLLSLHM